MEIKKKWLPIVSVICTLLMVGAFCAPQLNTTEKVQEEGIAGLIVGALVGVVLAVALLPTIVTQSDTLSANMTASNHTTEATLIDLWPLLLVIGVMMAIIGLAL